MYTAKSAETLVKVMTSCHVDGNRDTSIAGYVHRWIHFIQNTYEE